MSEGNIFQAIEKYGHDEDFEPIESPSFEATDEPPGSLAKIELLRRRVELGLPLWHPNDRNDFAGLITSGRSLVRVPELRRN